MPVKSKYRRLCATAEERWTYRSSSYTIPRKVGKLNGTPHRSHVDMRLRECDSSCQNRHHGTACKGVHGQPDLCRSLVYGHRSSCMQRKHTSYQINLVTCEHCEAVLEDEHVQFRSGSTTAFERCMPSELNRPRWSKHILEHDWFAIVGGTIESVQGRVLEISC